MTMPVIPNANPEGVSVHQLPGANALFFGDFFLQSAAYQNLLQRLTGKRSLGIRSGRKPHRGSQRRPGHTLEGGGLGRAREGMDGREAKDRAPSQGREPVDRKSQDRNDIKLDVFGSALGLGESTAAGLEGAPPLVGISRTTPKKKWAGGPYCTSNVNGKCPNNCR
jgi:hypothetical protein